MRPDRAAPAEPEAADATSLAYAQEVHLANVRQLTFGGDNAEAYWAFNNDALVYQTTQPQAGIPCDRIFVMPLDEEATADGKRKPTQVSNGLGPHHMPLLSAGRQRGGFRIDPRRGQRLP